MTASSPSTPARSPALKYIDYAVLRAEVEIRWILDRIHFKPSSVNGDQWRGPCPLPNHGRHKDREQTFSVNVRRDIYQCFRCKSAGDQIDLWAALMQLSRQDAARDLHEWLHAFSAIPQICNSKTRSSRTTPPATPGN